MAVADGASAALDFSRRQIDHFLPRKHRERAWKKTVAYAQERPLLFVGCPLAPTVPMEREAREKPD